MTKLLNELRKKNEAKNELKDKVIDYLNKELVHLVDDEFQGVLDILGIERSETEFKWERI